MLGVERLNPQPRTHKVRDLTRLFIIKTNMSGKKKKKKTISTIWTRHHAITFVTFSSLTNLIFVV
jgi:hypothetical protein